MQEWQIWYDTLNKPSWTPSGASIGLIWTILYPIIFLTYGFIFYKVFKQKLPVKIALPFVINLLANFLFTPLFFGMQNLRASLVDVVVIWATIVWTIIILYKYDKRVAWLQIPYLAWVSVATYLQLFLTFNN